MNILQLCNKVPYPPKDGGSLATWSLTSGMMQHGVKLKVISMQTSKHSQTNEELPPEIANNISYDIIPLNTDIKITRLIHNLLFSKLPYNLERFSSDKFSGEIISSINENTFDIILLEGLSMAIYIPLIRSYTSTKIVMRAHNIEYKIWEGLSESRKGIFRKNYLKILSSRLKHFEYLQLSFYDGIVPITENDAVLITKMGYKGPLQVIPFGMDLKNYQFPDKEPIPKDLIFIGALDWNPNIDGLNWFLNKVWPQIHKDYPDLHFHIAGRNPSKRLLPLFKTPGIKYYGEVEDTNSFMAKGSLLVVPLFSGSGMRIKIIEGLARKKCIVTTPKGSEGIPVEEGKHLLTASSSVEFINQIKKILENQNVCETLSQEGYQFVKQNYDNFALTKKLIVFFNQLIS
ncbi:MAG: glycosyltransferase [Bacteroidales bacterium]|nr:glycosyltransferase [Bacteroidales bacterium]